MNPDPITILVIARGGSKGVPGKNLAHVGGIPLVGRAVLTARETLRRSGMYGRVILSTDDPEIADVARDWGAEIPFVRPAALAADSTAVIDVVLHAIREAGLSEGSLVLIQPTTPLTHAEDLADAIQLHINRKASVISVTHIEHPVEWNYCLSDQQELTPLLKTVPVFRRQDASACVRLNGGFYIASIACLISNRSFFSQPTLGYLVSNERSVDIDCPLDLDLARFLVSRESTFPIEIEGRSIGQDQPCFIIAEAGVNHNGELDMALRLIDAAAEAGVDAVKFQTFSAKRLVSRHAPKAKYQRDATDASETQLEMLQRLELSQSDHLALIAHAASRGIIFLSSPFDEFSADFLESLGVPAYKIPSGEITNLPFLAHVARKGLPLIVSTGMADMREVDTAVRVIHRNGNPPLALLHCVSNYPAQPCDVNLRAMTTMRDAYHAPVGYSDHTEGNAIALAAIATGASIIEKHFTLNRSLPGPDHRASIEPDELRDLVRCIRDIEKALGDGRKVPAPSEIETARVARKSLFAATFIPCGSIITEQEIVARRPGCGISPQEWTRVIGLRTRIDIREGDMLNWEMFE